MNNQSKFTPTKTVIVTGGNTGLGYFTAKDIAKNSDWYVVIASRNPNAQKAAEQMSAETGNPNIKVLNLDLASLASVRAFVKNYEAQDLPPLHAIVCNAGLQVITASYTKDGYETTFGVNHLGHFLLVNLLLPRISASGQIVFIGSETHDPEVRTGMPAPNFSGAETLAHPKDTPENTGKSLSWLGRRRYSTSKLCNVMCAYELNRLLQAQKKPIRVNVFDPGLLPGSGLVRQYSSAARFIWNFVFPVLRVLRPNDVSSAPKSGASMAKLVLDPAYENLTGKYLMFNGLKEIRSSKETYDSRKVAQFWQDSAKLAGLTPEENLFAAEGVQI